VRFTVYAGKKVGRRGGNLPARGTEHRRHAENAQNRRKRAGTSSRYRGVTWVKARGKWQAQVTLNGRRLNLGRFDSEDEAGAVVAAWRREHMPFSVEAA
jgi:hypothetical protein